MASSFMQGVKASVTRELWWPETDRSPDFDDVRQQVANEDWARIAIGVVRAGGAIVPRAQVRLMANILRVLEDAYLSANHCKAQAGEWSERQYFVAREYAVLDIMRDVRDIIQAGEF